MAKYLYQNQILSQGQIRQLHPNVSLPRTWNQDTLDFLKVTPVFDTPKPTTDDLTKQYVQDGTEIDAKGNTVIKWTLVDKFSDTLEATKLEQEASYLESLKTQKKQAMKQARVSATESTSTITLNAINYEFDCDASARSAIHQSIDNATLAGLTDSDTTQWKLADNSFQSFTFGELKLAALQIAQFIQAQYTQEAVKNAEIDAATLTTIEAISWES